MRKTRRRSIAVCCLPFVVLVV